MGLSHMLFDKFYVQLKFIPKKCFLRQDWNPCCVHLGCRLLQLLLCFSVSAWEHLLYLVLYLFRGKDSFLLSVCVGLQKTGYRSS